jgi:hypothetical protein
MKEWGCYDETIWVDMSGGEAPQRIADAANATGIKWDGVFATHDHQQALTGQVWSLSVPTCTHLSHGPPFKRQQNQLPIRKKRTLAHVALNES